MNVLEGLRDKVPYFDLIEAKASVLIIDGKLFKNEMSYQEEMSLGSYQAYELRWFKENEEEEKAINYINQHILGNKVRITPLFIEKFLGVGY